MSNGFTFEILTGNSGNVVEYFKSDLDHWRSNHRHFKSYLNHYKAAQVTSSVDKIIFFVVKFTLVVAEKTFKVIVLSSFVFKITFEVTEITF